MRRYGRTYRRRRRGAVGRRVLIGVGVVLPTFVAVGLCVAVLSRRPAVPPASAAPASRVPGTGTASAPLAAAARAAPAGPALFVVASHTLRPDETRALARATDAGQVLPADVAVATVGPTRARTEVIGVDPSVFRWLTPAATAGSAMLWRRVAAGDGVLSPPVEAEVRARLGGSVAVGTGRGGVGVRVGGVAATALPGVGLVVDRRRSARLGLVPGAGAVLVVSAPHDPVVLAAAAAQALPGVDARPLRRVQTDPVSR